MGLRGPAPRPLELARLLGNPGKRRLNIETAHFAPKVDPPSWLDALARKEWKRLAPELDRLGMLTSADRAAFACYCASYALLVEAQAALKLHGLVYTTPAGIPAARPEIQIAKSAMRNVLSFAHEFGFSPSARGRIELPKRPETADEDLD